MVPICHTKIVLLGEMWWHDEDGWGGVSDVIGFRPERLWVGSANGTHRSRSSLEFGMWLDEPKALQAAEAFLVQLMATPRRTVTCGGDEGVAYWAASDLLKQNREWSREWWLPDLTTP
ncbi:hypothetical protein OG800_50605 (plasmid) [Streptomyces sp. NBC_00445]|uniref:hypothetical protein n=1 Tax=Streptomyces sp. NBC_00445 TaxID=2975745 RepID=UPI002E1D1FCA